MKMIKQLALRATLLIALTACGGQDDKVAVNPVKAPPTKAVVTLYSSGSSTLRGILQVQVNLPSGVSVQVSSGVTDGGVVAASGSATGAELEYGLYSWPTVTAVIGKSAGFSGGEYAIINCNIAKGSLPKSSDFGIANTDGRDVKGVVISGLTVSFAVAMH